MIKISDLKVLGVKVKQSVYDEFRRLDGCVSDNLRRAISNYINHNEETRLTTVNDKNKIDEYKHLAIELKTITDDLSRFYNGLLEFGIENKIFLLFAEVINFDIQIIGLIESIVELQFNHITEDHNNAQESKDKVNHGSKNNFWEED